MLVAYDPDGAVVFHISHSLYPDGPPDEMLPAMFAAAGVEPAGYLRISDVSQPEQAQALDTRQVHVDVAAGTLVVGDPLPDPAPAAVPPSREEFTAVVSALEDLTMTVLMGGL